MTKRRTARFIFSVLLILPAPTGSADSAELPRPVVEFTFDNGLNNTGTGGGAGTVTVYAEGDAPVLARGPWARCLDLSQSSRFGGTTADKDPAGAAMLYSGTEVDQLSDFSVTFWMKAPVGERGIASRILTKSSSWEITYGDGLAAFYATESHSKRHYNPQRLTHDPRGRWTFVAMVVDAAEGKMKILMGDRVDGLAEEITHDLVEPIPQTESALEIGNFNGIRPFKGLIDSFRIYGQSLSSEQIQVLFESDQARTAPPELVYSRGITAHGQRAFRLKPSAIPFSSRWQNRKKEQTFQLLDAYHATHLLWVYGMNPAYVKEVKDKGIFYEGTLNGMYGAHLSGEDPNATTDTTGRAWNFDGRKFVPRHMEAWPESWRHWRGCHNSPDFRKVFWEGVDTLVDIGCDAIQVDDWEMVLAPASTGRGCFCPACMELLRGYLKQTYSEEQLHEFGIEDVNVFDYGRYLRSRYGITNAEECFAEYRTIFRDDPLAEIFVSAQRMGLRDFYKRLRAHLNEVSPDRYIPISVNNQFYRRAADRRFRGYYCADVVDFFIGEVSQSMQDANHFIHCSKLAEGFDVPQVMMSKPHVLAKGQAALATTYALGSCMRVPWDAYMDNDPKTRQPAPRYYGELDDWGPFYDFVHQHARLFDNTEPVAEVAVILNADIDNFTPFWSLANRLARDQIQFRVIPATSQYNRIPLNSDMILKVSHAILLSPEESFCEEDRRVLASVRQSLRVRFLSPDEDIAAALDRAGEKLLHVEGPKGVYAFVRTRPNSAVIHLVNWNVTADAADAFHYVTLQLPQPKRWGEAPTVTYYEPGRSSRIKIEPERHASMLRITVPRIETWGIVEIGVKENTE